MKKDYVRPLDIRHGRVDMNHGAGGRAAAQLIEELFARELDNDFLRQGDDGALLTALPAGHRLVMATDAHVISPLFFPGGDIGSLSVHGTINDVAMMGATPLYLSASFILEEGFALAELQRIVASMAAAARAAGVPVVTGDTKVVERGKGDGVFISTTGVGMVPEGRTIGGARARPGDAVLLSGSIGEHGVAVLSQRESLEFETAIVSDSAALHTLVAAMLAAAPDGAVHVLRDPTRGGLATTLNEIARQSRVGITLDEACIPVLPQVDAACELLGLDPAVCRQRGQAGGDGRAGVCRGGARGDAFASTRRRCRMHRRGLRRRAALRADGHSLRRTAHGRLAQRRAAAAHLLTSTSMRILLLTHSFNSLAQRLFAELREDGHEVSVEFDIADAVTEEAVAMWRPELVVAPFLKRRIPESVWSRVPCLIVHPGPPGDRGPASLDWAILEGAREWGVTVIQATGDYDGGPVWAAEGFAMREARKSSLYRNEVTGAALRAVRAAIAQGGARVLPPVQGGLRAAPGRDRRTLDWARMDSATVWRTVAAADGRPGAIDRLFGIDLRSFDAHPASADDLARARDGAPGAVVARRGPALLRRTLDGGVWVSRAQRDPAMAGQPALKLAATQLFAAEAEALPELAVPLAHSAHEWDELRYEEFGPPHARVGWLEFDVHNGAFGIAQCNRLREALHDVKRRDIRVLVLAGGADFFSNGIDLNAIEAAAHRPGDSAADASWRNIEAIDDAVLELLSMTDRITVAALRGNAGAGGCFVALAADRVWAHGGVILNPHYKNMGNLYGSEYWTYTLPRRVGADNAARIMRDRLPLGARAARTAGIVDAVLAPDAAGFDAAVRGEALVLAAAPQTPAEIENKRRRRERDEAERPLAAYRADELQQMQRNFYGFDPSYHVARHHFVTRKPHAWTPRHLARHRS